MEKVTASEENKISYRKLYEQIHRTYEGDTECDNEDRTSLKNRLKSILFHLKHQ